MNKTTFNRRLSSVMKDNIYDREVSNKRSGRLDMRKLYKASHSGKVFKVREERKGKHYKVSILADCSGSMAKFGDKVTPTINAVKELAHSLKANHIEFEVRGYNTYTHDFKRFNEKFDADEFAEKFRKQVGEIRDDDDVTNIMYTTSSKRPRQYLAPRDFYKNQDEREARYEKYRDHDWSSIHICQGNCDGFAVRETVERQKDSKGTHILIMLSDGRPHLDAGDGVTEQSDGKEVLDAYGLSAEVEHAMRVRDVKFIGVGIDTDDIARFYPPDNTIIMWDGELEKMYEGIVNILKKFIKRG